VIRALLFRALNRADREYPRFERVIADAATITAVGLYCVVVATGLALSVVVVPAVLATAKLFDAATGGES
jgi:hypothetical protein